MQTSNRVDRRSAVFGGVLGAGVLAVLAGAMGVGSAGVAGDRVVS